MSRDFQWSLLVIVAVVVLGIGLLNHHLHNDLLSKEQRVEDLSQPFNEFHGMIPSFGRLNSVNARLQARIRKLDIDRIRLEAGVRAMKAGRLAEARQVFHAVATANGPLAPFARIDYGVILDRQGNSRQALDEYRKALRSPRFKGFSDDANRTIERAVKKCYYNVGVAYEKLGKTAEASKAFAEASRSGCEEPRQGPMPGL